MMDNPTVPPTGNPAASVVLCGVTVVDTRDGSLRPNMDVAMQADRIVSIAPAGATPRDPAAVTIDAVGRFVVPGYLDMHVHALQSEDPSSTMELMLANGITGIRQMAGSPKLLKQRQSGTLPVPKDSPAVLAMPGTILTPFNAGTGQAATATVREQKAAGADFIKVGFVTPAIFFQAQSEANRLGIPIGGHLPVGIDVVAASNGGIRFIEHLGPGVGILAACSTDETGMRQALATPPALKAPPVKIPFLELLMWRRMRKVLMNPTSRSTPADIAILQRAVSTFSEEKCRALAATFVANSTWQTPTLIRERTSELCDAPEFRNDPNLRYVALSAITEWTSVTDAFERRPPEDRATFRAAYELQMKLTKLLDESGVQMLAGSDVTGAVWEIPGFSLHQEFDELGKAGLSSLRVLQMTTLNGAEFLGKTADMGTVEVGKIADLVLLDANPALSVANLHAISGVVRSGHYYSSTDLEIVKSRIATARSIK
jgi:hypothetical protein